MKMRKQSFRLLLVLAMFSSMLHAFVPHSHHAEAQESHQIRHWTANHLLDAKWWHELLDLFSDIEHPAAGDDFYFHAPCADDTPAIAVEWHFSDANLLPVHPLVEWNEQQIESPIPLLSIGCYRLIYLSSAPVRGSPLV